MKTNTRLLSLLLAALGCIAASTAQAAPPAPNVAMMYRVKFVDLHRIGGDELKVGATRTAVERALGRPHQKASDNVWIYRRFRAADRDDANRDRCSSLVFTFDGERSIAIRLLNEKAVGIVVAQARATPTVTPRALLAAK